MKKIVYLSVFVLLVGSISCSREDVNEEQPVSLSQETDSVQEVLSVAEINVIIDTALKTSGDFNWADVEDTVLWSALQHAGGVLTVGYGAEDVSQGKSNQQLDIKNKIIASVKSMEADLTSASKEEDVLIYDDEFLTVIDVKVQQLTTVTALRENKEIRYLEPAGYPYLQESTAAKSASSSGCGYEGESLYVSDYTIVSPNAKMPWNFTIHQIDQAWAYSTGSNVTIGIVDTGLSPNQPLLGNQFNSGASSGRSVEKYGTYVDSFWPWSSKTDGPNDKCGHGTSMAAAAVAPRNNAGLPVGVAYNANLISYRAASSVVLSGYHDQKGVAKAITNLANRSDVKIISMSMGHVFSVGRIKDAIRYAYNRNKLIFCAGGTSTSFTNFVGVIFPANMDETVAVTGVEEGSGYQECDTCHEGSKIDFTMVMERSNNHHVPVLSYYNGQADYVGGSSVATASAAGIAALVWSKYPGYSRDQVLQKLKSTADLYPNKSNSFGYGNLNALAAVQ